MTPEERADAVMEAALPEAQRATHVRDAIAAAIREAQGEAARRAIRSYEESRRPEMEAIRASLAAMKAQGP